MRKKLKADRRTGIRDQGSGKGWKRPPARRGKGGKGKETRGDGVKR